LDKGVEFSHEIDGPGDLFIAYISVEQAEVAVIFEHGVDDLEQHIKSQVLLECFDGEGSLLWDEQGNLGHVLPHMLDRGLEVRVLDEVGVVLLPVKGGVADGSAVFVLLMEEWQLEKLSSHDDAGVAYALGAEY